MCGRYTLAQISPGLTAYPVSTLVNSPANDEPGCIEPLGTPC